MLNYPSKDGKLILSVDTSDRSVGGALYSEENGVKKILSYSSKKIR